MKLVLAQLGLGVAFGVVSMAGGTPGSLVFGALAALASVAVIRWPSAGCLMPVVCAAIAIAFGDSRVVSLLAAAVCGLLGVLFVLAGNVRRGRGTLAARLDLLAGSAIAVAGAGIGAFVDTGWGWLAVLVPVGAAAVYLTAMLALRTPAAISGDPDR
ncbi:hypothetical protein [Fodinicola acaciae]|uniref:hypothetical protein n=1 Tax=Fodinicola acaciae TaxID=2681555 RepID=UPI0013D8D187|nr:hypothetical protein [Fodinicola acaciae]